MLGIEKGATYDDITRKSYTEVLKDCEHLKAYKKWCSYWEKYILEFLHD